MPPYLPSTMRGAMNGRRNRKETVRRNEPRHNPGLFYTRNSPRFTRAHHYTEPFRMTLEDTGLAIGAFLWAGFLCDKVHH
ncbi:hypothetical protein CWN55_19485 [Klebsiella pneumoniae]|nr:hypothetical protein CWN55_19485 [Klebsiella pneumoniae]